MGSVLAAPVAVVGTAYLLLAPPALAAVVVGAAVVVVVVALAAIAAIAAVVVMVAAFAAMVVVVVPAVADEIVLFSGLHCGVAPTPVVFVVQRAGGSSVLAALAVLHRLLDALDACPGPRHPTALCAKAACPSVQPVPPKHIR